MGLTYRVTDNGCVMVSRVFYYCENCKISYYNMNVDMSHIKQGHRTRIELEEEQHWNQKIHGNIPPLILKQAQIRNREMMDDRLARRQINQYFNNIKYKK